MKAGSPPTLSYFAAPPARRARFVAWIICTALLLGGTPAWLFFLRDARILDNDPILIGGWITLGAVLLAVFVLLKTTPRDAIRLSSPASSWILIAGTTLLQLAALISLSPALSDDPARYRVEGLMWLEGTSPYATASIDFVGRTRGADVLDGMVPSAHLHTIYPPVAQAVFAGARALEKWLLPYQGPPIAGEWREWITWLPKPYQAGIFRAWMAALAIASVAVLLPVLRHARLSPWYAVLLGWNPLFVLETAGMGHVDVLGVLLVLLSIRAMQSRRPLLAAGMLALACGVKPQAVVLFPFLFRDLVRSGAVERAVRLAVASVLFLAVIYSPLLIQRGYVGWMTTMKIYATSWEANGSIFELVKATADDTDGVAVQRAKDRARALAAAAVVATLLAAWWLGANFVMAGYWVHLVAMLFSPVVYPWYLLWALCFVPLLRGWQGATALVWSATAGISYLLWRTHDWVLPTWAALAEYVPVYLALGFELTMMARDRWFRRIDTATPLPAATAPAG